MNKYLKRSVVEAVSITSLLFMFIPEDTFKMKILFSKLSVEINVIINKGFFFIAVIIFTLILNLFCRKVCVEGKNYKVQIKYGNLFKEKKCKIVIPFDECFSINVGLAPSDINPQSICGQYLLSNPNLDIQFINPHSISYIASILFKENPSLCLHTIRNLYGFLILCILNL